MAISSFSSPQSTAYSNLTGRSYKLHLLTQRPMLAPVGGGALAPLDRPRLTPGRSPATSPPCAAGDRQSGRLSRNPRAPSRASAASPPRAAMRLDASPVRLAPCGRAMLASIPAPAATAPSPVRLDPRAGLSEPRQSASRHAGEPCQPRSGDRARGLASASHKPASPPRSARPCAGRPGSTPAASIHAPASIPRGHAPRRLDPARPLKSSPTDMLAWKCMLASYSQK